MNVLTEQSVIAAFFALVGAFVSFMSSWAVTKAKVKDLETRTGNMEAVASENKNRLERRDEEIRNIRERLNKIDDLKIDANLAAIKADIRNILTLLETR